MTNQPSKREQVEPLLKALEYIAKMVKQRGAFNQNEIPMLLSASGVDPESGKDQLKRWAKILKAVYEDSSKLQLGQTALMKFGIPEAHAMLADLTVVKKLVTLHDRSRGLYLFLDGFGEIVRSNSDL